MSSPIERNPGTPSIMTRIMDLLKNKESKAKTRKDKTALTRNEDITELFCLAGDFCRMIEKDIPKARIKEGKKGKKNNKNFRIKDE